MTPKIGKPPFAYKERPEPWHYCGWIPRKPQGVIFEDAVKREKRSDHGELREVDIYEDGAVFWWAERTPLTVL